MIMHLCNAQITSLVIVIIIHLHFYFTYLLNLGFFVLATLHLKSSAKWSCVLGVTCLFTMLYILLLDSVVLYVFLLPLLLLFTGAHVPCGLLSVHI